MKIIITTDAGKDKQNNDSGHREWGQWSQQEQKTRVIFHLTPILSPHSRL